MAADEIKDEEIDILYEKGLLGQDTPSSIINTMWFNNTLFFGLRGGGEVHRRLRWGDIKLCHDTK